MMLFNPYTRVRKQTMKDFGDFIQQYYKQNTCEQPAQETLHENLNKFRKEHAGRLNELGRHFVYDPLSEYDKKIAEVKKSYLIINRVLSHYKISGFKNSLDRTRR